MPAAPDDASRAARSGAVVPFADQRRPFRPTPVLWLALVLVALPILVSTAQHATGGWLPEGDDAWVGRRVRQVFTTDPPLIGQESTADERPTDQGLSHPGPVAYYLLALPYGLSGWSPVGLAVGAGLVVLGAACAAVVAAWRAAGDRGAAAASLALALVAVRLSQEWLVRPTSSTSVVFPLLAAAFGLWAYLRGDRLGLAIALFAGTYAFQTSLVVLPLSLALLTATLALAAWRRHARGHGDMSRAGWIAVGVLALLWLPPWIELFASWPGNLAELARYLLASVGLVDREGTTAGSLGLGAALATIVTYVGGIPGTDGRTLSGAAAWLVDLGSLSLARAVAVLAGVAGTVAWAVRRRSGDLLALLGVFAGVAVVGVIAFSLRPTTSLFTQTYFVVWIQAIAGIGWTAGLLAVVEWADERFAPARVEGRRRRPAPAFRPAVVGALVLAALAAGAASLGTVDRDHAQRVADLSAQVRADLPVGTYALIGEGPMAWSSTAKGLGLDLIGHGYDIRFQEWGGMVDEPRRRLDRSMDLLLVTTEYPDLPDAVMLARRTDDEADLQVHLIPGGRFQAFCRAAGPALRPALERSDAGTPSTASEALAALEALNPGAIAADTPAGVLEETLRAVERTRDQALAQLRAAPPDAPVEPVGLAPEFTAAYASLLEGFAQTCAPPRTR